MYLHSRLSPQLRQGLAERITKQLHIDLTTTCRLLDYVIDGSTTGIDLTNKKWTTTTIPIDQIQTVYRSLMRAEPNAVQKLCLALKKVSGVENCRKCKCQSEF